MSNIVTWFEIPATDVARAAKFYETVLQRKVIQQDMGGVLHAFFEHSNNEVGGAIVKEDGLQPSKHGVLVYFDCNNDLETFLARVEHAGGQIEKPKTLIAPEVGWLATFIDTEGNRMAFYSKA